MYNILLTFSVAVSIIVLASVSIMTRFCLLKIFKPKYRENCLQTETIQSELQVLKGMDRNKVKELIVQEAKQLGTDLRIIATELSGATDKVKRRQINKCFMNCLVEVKLGGPQALIWLKSHVDFEVCDKILSDWNYSGTHIQIIGDKIMDLKEKVERLLANLVETKCNEFIVSMVSVIINQIFRLATVAIAYLDLTFDSVLLFTIIKVLGSTWNDMEYFSNYVTFLLLTSILIPGIITAVSIAYTRPLVVLGFDTWSKWSRANIKENWKHLFILRILIVCIFPFIPAMILISSIKAEEKRNALNLSDHQEDASIQSINLKEYDLITRYKNETSLALLTFKRNELNIEIVIQLSIHVTMVMLSQTDFPVETGLQSIFQSMDEDQEKSSTTVVFLILSVLWSFKTSALTAISIKTETKTFLPLLSKILLGIRYLLIFLVRICAIVSYFAPFLGLLGILNHYQAERYALHYELFKNINDINGTNDQQFHYWNPYEDEFQSINIQELFRSNYTISDEPTRPPPTYYTGISLGYAFVIFCVMYYLFYALIITVIKCHVSKSFKSASISERFQHIVEAINMPESYGDWDTDLALDLDGHLKKWSQVLMEMLIMVLMQLISNMSMLVPFFIMGKYKLFDQLNVHHLNMV